MKRLSLIALIACLFASSTVPVAAKGWDWDNVTLADDADNNLMSLLVVTALLRMVPEGMAINALNSTNEETVKNASCALAIENAAPVVLAGVKATTELGVFLSNLGRNVVGGYPRTSHYTGYDINGDDGKTKHNDAFMPLLTGVTSLIAASPFAHTVYQNWQKAKTAKERVDYLNKTEAAVVKMTSVKKKQWVHLALNTAFLLASGWLFIASSKEHNNSNMERITDFFSSNTTKEGGFKLLAVLGCTLGAISEYKRISNRKYWAAKNDANPCTEDELKAPSKDEESDDDENDDEDDDQDDEDDEKPAKKGKKAKN